MPGDAADAGEEAESDACPPDAPSAPAELDDAERRHLRHATSRSTAISPSIPRWCWASTRCGAASTVPGSPTPAGRGPVPHPRDLADGGARPVPTGIVTPSAESTADGRRRRCRGDGRHRSRRRHHQGRLLLHRQGRAADPDRGWRAGRGGDQAGQGRRRHPHPRREDHPRPAADPRRDARRAARAGRRPALGGGAGPAAHRLQQLRPRLRADQPHRIISVTRPGDRRGAGDPSPAQPRAVRRRSRLLAGCQHRGLRPRKRPRPHGADLPRAGDRPAGRAADRDRGRCARRHAQRDRPRRHRPSGRTAGPRSGDRPRPTRRGGVPQSGDDAWETDDAYLSGSVRTKLAIAEAAAERDPQYARNVAALRACSRRTSARRTSPRVWARRGFRPPTSRRSPPR